MKKPFGNNYWAMWLIVLIAITIITYANFCGLGFTYDSHDYYAASQGWKSHNNLINDNGSLYNFHAPLFPILISIFTTGNTASLIIMNGVVGFSTMVFLLVITRDLFENDFLRILSLMSIVMSVGFLMIHHFLWTEPIFLLLFIAHNYFLTRFLMLCNTRDFVGLLIVAFTLGIIKNTGFFIILVSAFIILLSQKKLAFKYMISYLFVGSLGFTIWNVSVLFFRKGHAVYFDSNFLHGFRENVPNYLDIISQWFFPALIPFYVRIILMVILVLTLAVLASRQTSKSQAWVFMLQFVGYLVIMVFVIEVDIDEIERLLAIVAPWLMIAIFMTFDANWMSLPKLARRCFSLFFVLWICYIGIRGIHNAVVWHQGTCREELLSDLLIAV